MNRRAIERYLGGGYRKLFDTAGSHTVNPSPFKWRAYQIGGISPATSVKIVLPDSRVYSHRAAAGGIQLHFWPWPIAGTQTVQIFAPNGIDVLGTLDPSVPQMFTATMRPFDLPVQAPIPPNTIPPAFIPITSVPAGELWNFTAHRNNGRPTL